MAKAYSYDLQQKVINTIELDGMKKSEAAQVFQLSRDTIDLWLKRQKATGDYHIKTLDPIEQAAKSTIGTSLPSLPSSMGTKPKPR